MRSPFPSAQHSLDDVTHMVIHTRSSNFRDGDKLYKICQLGLIEHCYYLGSGRWRANFSAGFCCSLINVHICYVNITHHVCSKGCVTLQPKLPLPFISRFEQLHRILKAHVDTQTDIYISVQTKMQKRKGSRLVLQISVLLWRWYSYFFFCAYLNKGF